MDELTMIGRAEVVAFPELGMSDVPARIDTGARTSSIWVSEATEKDGALSVVFFGKGTPFYTGEKVVFYDFRVAAIASSNGYVEERYKVRMAVVLSGRKIRASFTLADRSMQVYPVLVGRNILAGKFLVDVKLGTPLISQEKDRETEKRRIAKKLKRNRTKD